MENKNIIGSELKRIRQQLGLTQDEMTGGIIRKSHYSKVERGIEGISANSLLKILFIHNIDIDQFFEDIKEKYYSPEKSKAEALETCMMKSFNESDINSVRKCLSEILELKDYRILKYRAIIAVAMFENKLDDLSSEFKNEIFLEFTDHNNWAENIDSLRLFGNCLQIFTIEQIDVFMKQLLRHYEDKNSKSEKMLERVAIICNNYLYHCYYDKVDGSNIKSCLDYLNCLDKQSHFLFYHICYEFYKSLFDGNKAKAQEMKNFLISCGYKDRVASWKI